MSESIPLPAAAVVEEATAAVMARAVVARLFVLSRVVMMHGPRHPLVAQTVASLAHAMVAAEPPFALQFVGEGVFRDRELVPLDVEHFQYARQLARMLSHLGVHELSIDAAPSAEALTQLGVLLGHASQGPCDELERAHLPGLRFREIPAARWGSESVQIDAELFAIAQVALSIHDAEALFARRDAAWPWPTGVGLIRRLERAMETSPAATLRALDTAPGQWTVARRSLAASHHVLTALHGLEVNPSTRRAIAHASLAIAIHGLRERDGLAFHSGARQALRHMLEAPLPSRTGVEPHRLRTLALVHGISTRAEAPANWTGPMALMEIGYQLERRRCPGEVSFALTRVDLLAYAAEKMGTDFDARWVRALVTQCGQIPPGASVRLADGRIGMAMEPGASGDPMRPRVLVGGQTVEPMQPVRLVSAVS